MLLSMISSLRIQVGCLTHRTCTWRDRSSANSGTRPWRPGEPFQVGCHALDAADLDALWDGLYRVDTHFWREERLERIRRNDTQPREHTSWPGESLEVKPRGALRGNCNRDKNPGVVNPGLQSMAGRTVQPDASNRLITHRNQSD